MRTFSKFLVTFYTLIFMVMGIVLVFLALHFRKTIDLSFVFEYFTDNPNLWIILAASGIVLVVVSFSLAKLAYGSFQREKTIAFNNPEGQVTISLSAIEDVIKRITKQVTEVREIRSYVSATRKGIDITSRIVLWSDTNIPEVTEKIQSIVRNHVQEMLGIEEPIIVKVHVVKIVQKEQSKEAQKQHPQQEFPYMG
ncbi:MAG: alkaline shock response membrane anchor protein AmaP [Candidatus Omnitrophota bacterium]